MHQNDSLGPGLAMPAGAHFSPDFLYKGRSLQPLPSIDAPTQSFPSPDGTRRRLGSGDNPIINDRAGT